MQESKLERLWYTLLIDQVNGNLQSLFYTTYSVIRMLTLLLSGKQLLWQSFKNIATLCLKLVIVGFLVKLLIAWSDLNYISALIQQALATFNHDILFNPWFYGVVPTVLLIEIWLPARQQPLLSVGFWQDCLWLLYDLMVNIFLLGPYLSVLDTFAQVTGFPIFDLAAILSPPILILCSILLSDFLIWFSHILRHHIPAFWYFHAVHHSQTELNLFCGLRFHVIDTLITYTIVTVPMRAIGISLPSIILFRVIQQWYLRIYHSNLKLNYGWLKHVIITPQSHRIHHSIEPHHRDRNFGSVLFLWDYLFGTQYCQYDEYPATGIDDPNFPLEISSQPHHLFITLVYQNLYPFQQLWNSSINPAWLKKTFIFLQSQK
ncbi:hypothetical protein BJP34_16115 [Moorena producens PAL-8-15-08-1]|uniref:Fatty acid hydroxylase domain-containing protein n=1 Tax=Moorena producens PAL-8-15-08-1 TaxID=1458985 RepID=A0A1D8TT68_9CYAN|nr:sterol desaturase family protein [Moorena producens]AOX00765.1 hypothetical protein BJP34_16115 [Moorena producens PAL-8-15-08-1]